MPTVQFPQNHWFFDIACQMSSCYAFHYSRQVAIDEKNYRVLAKR